MSVTKSEKKTHQIVVHVSKREKEAAVRAARKRKLPASAYVRGILLAAAAKKAA